MKPALFALVFAFGAAVAQAAPAFVDAAWLEKQLTNAKIVVVDMSATDDQYLRFHLPGALRLPYDALIKERKPDKVKVRLDDAALARVLGRLGITRDHHVVIYDDVGGLNAARLFWELERIGHPEVSVLDGGLVQWILTGRKVVNTPASRLPTTYPVADAAVPGGSRKPNEATLADMRAALNQRNTLLLDVRTEEEYVGEPKKPRTGHVPGARLLPWDLTVDFEHGFVQRDEPALKQLLASVGADPDVPVIAYCRSGHRATRVYLALRSLGYGNVQVYANSMNEYALTPDAPLKQGKHP